MTKISTQKLFCFEIGKNEYTPIMLYMNPLTGSQVRTFLFTRNQLHIFIYSLSVKRETGKDESKKNCK